MSRKLHPIRRAHRVETRSVLGERLRELRLARGLSQDALAGRCELWGTAISAIEKGKANVLASTIVRLCEGLDCSADELLGLAPLPPRPDQVSPRSNDHSVSKQTAPQLSPESRRR